MTTDAYQSAQGVAIPDDVLAEIEAAVTKGHPEFDPAQARDTSGRWVSVWHGTTEDHLDAILHEGLKRTESGHVWMESKPATIYITHHATDDAAAERAAKDWAHSHAGVHADRGDPPDMMTPAVVQAKIPRAVWKKYATPDVNLAANDDATMGWEFKADIKPEWITGAWLSRWKDLKLVGWDKVKSAAADTDTVSVWIGLALPDRPPEQTKGYPEFDPDQPRDEGGQWSDGGVATDRRATTADRRAAREALEAAGWQSIRSQRLGRYAQHPSRPGETITYPTPDTWRHVRDTATLGEGPLRDLPQYLGGLQAPAAAPAQDPEGRLTPEAWASVVARGGETAHAPVEHLALIDPTSGERVYVLSNDSVDTVDVPDEDTEVVTQLAVDRVMMHNHPPGKDDNSLTFSLADMKTAVGLKVRESVVATRDWLYRITTPLRDATGRPNWTVSPDGKKVNDVATAVMADFRSRKWDTTVEAKTERQHQFWVTVAKEMGWVYSRTAPPWTAAMATAKSARQRAGGATVPLIDDRDPFRWMDDPDSTWETKGYPEYREDQARDAGGRWSEEGTGPQIYMRPEDLEPGESWGGVVRWRHREGGFLLSPPMQKDDLPEVLYHTTTAEPSVRDAQMLRAQSDGGGMGGGSGMRGVSFTTSLADAELMQTSLRREIALAQRPPDPTGEHAERLLRQFAAEDAAAVGVPAGSFDRAVAYAMEGYQANLQHALHPWDDGQFGPPYPPDHPERLRKLRSLGHDAHGAYLQARESDAAGALGVTWQQINQEDRYAPVRNPLIFGNADHFMRLNPGHVGILRVPSRFIPDGALIRAGSDSFLHEIRVHADVPFPRGTKGHHWLLRKGETP